MKRILTTALPLLLSAWVVAQSYSLEWSGPSNQNEAFTWISSFLLAQDDSHYPKAAEGKTLAANETPKFYQRITNGGQTVDRELTVEQVAGGNYVWRYPPAAGGTVTLLAKAKMSDNTVGESQSYEVTVGKWKDSHNEANFGTALPTTTAEGPEGQLDETGEVSFTNKAWECKAIYVPGSSINNWSSVESLTVLLDRDVECQLYVEYEDYEHNACAAATSGLLTRDWHTIPLLVNHTDRRIRIKSVQLQSSGEHDAMSFKVVGLFQTLYANTGNAPRRPGNLIEQSYDFDAGLPDKALWKVEDQSSVKVKTVLEHADVSGNGCLKVIVGEASGASNSWHQQLCFDPGITLSQDETYEVSFDAWADQPTTITTKCQQTSGDYAGNGYNDHKLTTERQHFTRTITATNPNVTSFRFQVGAVATNVYVDNVSIKNVYPGAQESDGSDKYLVGATFWSMTGWPGDASALMFNGNAGTFGDNAKSTWDKDKKEITFKERYATCGHWFESTVEKGAANWSQWGTLVVKVKGHLEGNLVVAYTDGGGNDEVAGKYDTKDDVTTFTLNLTKRKDKYYVVQYYLSSSAQDASSYPLKATVIGAYLQPAKMTGSADGTVVVYEDSFADPQVLDFYWNIINAGHDPEQPAKRQPMTEGGRTDDALSPDEQDHNCVKLINPVANPDLDSQGNKVYYKSQYALDLPFMLKPDDATMVTLYAKSVPLAEGGAAATGTKLQMSWQDPADPTKQGGYRDFEISADDWTEINWSPKITADYTFQTNSTRFIIGFGADAGAWLIDDVLIETHDASKMPTSTRIHWYIDGAAGNAVDVQPGATIDEYLTAKAASYPMLQAQNPVQYKYYDADNRPNIISKGWTFPSEGSVRVQADVRATGKFLKADPVSYTFNVVKAGGGEQNDDRALDVVSAAAPVVSTAWYTLDGKLCRQPTRGLLIKRETTADGKTSAKLVAVR